MTVTSLLALGALVWLAYVVVRARNYRRATADLLTDIWNFGLNQVLHRNIDAEQDFHKWLERYGVWKADVMQLMAQRHCTSQQRNYFDNLHKFAVQPELFHTDPERNWWKSMMSEQLDRLAKVIDEVLGQA